MTESAKNVDQGWPSTVRDASQDQAGASWASGPTDAKPARRAGWLIWLVCLALLVTNFWLVYDGRLHAIGQSQLANQNLARALSERIEASVSEASRILDGVVYELERTNLTQDVLDRMQPALVHHVAQSDQLANLFLYDAQGDWIATSHAVWSAGQNNSDRPYFTHHRDNPSQSALLGPPLMSRSTGRWVVPLSRRVNDIDGNFAGVALATLNLDHFQRLLSRFDLGQGAVTILVAGHHMTRRPLVAADVGRSAPAVRALIGDRRAGSGDVVSPIDGVARLYTFEQTLSYPIQVIVASSKSEILGRWWQASCLQTLWVLLLCFTLKRAVGDMRRAARYRRTAEARISKALVDLRDAHERLRQVAQLDGLTRLPNRAYFDRRFARVFSRAQREQRSVAILMIDVDEFKKYNDSHGHVEGDRCLAQIAAAVRGVLRRPDDFAARYGGEEFVVLLPDTDHHGACIVAEQARLAVSNLARPHDLSAHGTVTISVGVAATVPMLSDEREALLQAADQALYKAKSTGRNSFVVAPACGTCHHGGGWPETVLGVDGAAHAGGLAPVVRPSRTP